VDKWHRLSSLNYQAEIGDVGRITDAIMELCWDVKTEPPSVKEAEDQREIIDLTLDDDVIPDLQPDEEKIRDPKILVQDGCSIPRTEVAASDSIDTISRYSYVGEIDLTVFADDDSKMSLRELLDCLTLDELKAIARQTKIKTTQNVSI
jgi:fanconi-associated nuclease 1